MPGTRTVIRYALAAGLGAVGFFGSRWSGGAQTLRDTIPRNQPPLLRVMPPSQAEVVSARSEKIVIFSREQVGNGETWDFVAGAWELLPDQLGKPITKRAEFAHSGGSADFLVWDRRHFADQYVTVRVPEVVNLYRIDYRAWSIEVVLQAQGMFGFGVGGDNIYLRMNSGIRRLNRVTGALEAIEPLFAQVATFEDTWLVREQGSPRTRSGF